LRRGFSLDIKKGGCLGAAAITWRAFDEMLSAHASVGVTCG
jgi:hypothetical protein